MPERFGKSFLGLSATGPVKQNMLDWYVVGYSEIKALLLRFF
jgi:hypothetical protein